jgi:hypothetical protein
MIASLPWGSFENRLDQSDPGFAASRRTATYLGKSRFEPLAQRGQVGIGSARSVYEEGRIHMIILLALLLVVIFAGLGFALHVLWIVAVVLFVFWLIGLALGRGESAGNHRFYRW